MNHARPFRMLVGGLAAALALGTVGISAAEAKPAKPGGVPNLKGVPSWHSGTTYDVAATWDSVANATGYRASVTKAGVTLASKTVTGPSWDPTITSGPGQVVLQVQAVVRHRKGTPSKLTVGLPDMVAPSGQFGVSKDEVTKLGTITQTALDDDSGIAGVTRTVNWHDVVPADVPWTSGTTINHTYGLIGRYVPTVTLTDAAGNSVTYTLDAIVLGDVLAPSGSVGVSTTSAWTSFTHVVATPSGLLDDVSPGDMIGVDVTWGDGTSTASKGSAALDHVYTASGSYDVTYTIVDEAGNTTAGPIPGSTVVVTTDSLAPVVRLLLPRTHKHSVKTWRLLGGKATDTPGTGVKKVSLRAVEKRGTKWFGYRPATRTWVKAATKAAAYKKGRAFTLTTNLLHRWSAHLAGLRKGTLVYKVSAVDRVLNASKPLIHKATLTKP